VLALLSAPGSRGDVNPMVAIGKQLRQAGYDVVISLAEPYAPIAQAADLQVEPVISHASFDALVGDPQVWTPLRGVRRILGQTAADFLLQHDAVIRKYHRPRETILVSHPLDFASRVFRELDPETPLVDVHLAPATLRVPSAPPRLSPWWFEFRRPEWVVRASYWLADRLILDPVLAPVLGKLRQTYGLPPVDRYLDQWWLSPDLILAMFPHWFAPETSRVGKQLQHVGFPLDDGSACGDGDFDSLNHGAAEHPIVFTAGTAHQHCHDFFQHAVAACNRLGRHGLLLSTHAANIPSELPPQVTWANYVPLGRLLHQAAAIVHHGGIGTTSQALAAGIPQLIRPHAFDQFDNAERVEQLGCGRRLKNISHLTTRLEEVLLDPRVAEQCTAVARRMTSETESGASVAASRIMQLSG